ncbi:MAG: response regulator [Chromatiales bacterium]|nr:response regulator [Chromatiales bacterium]
MEITRRTASEAFSLGERILLWALVPLLCLASGLISVWLDRSQTAQTFTSEATIYRHGVAQRLNSVEVVLTSLTSLQQAQDDVSDIEFSTFAGELLRSYPYIRSLLRLRKIDDKERDELESDMHERGYFRFRIRQSESSDLRDSQHRPYYLPIINIEPLDPPNGRLLGFDPLSHKALVRTVNSAIRSGLVRASPMVRVADADRVLLFKAVYYGRYPPNNAAGRESMFAGAIGAELDIPRLLAGVITDTKRTTLSLDFDELPPTMSDLPPHPAELPALEGSFNKLAFVSRIDVHGQRATLRVSRDLGMESFSQPGFAIAVIGTALLSTSLILAWRSQRIRRFQELELERTVREDERRFKLVVDTAFDAVITTDRNGTVLTWNQQAVELFGWRQHEVIGKPLPEDIFPKAPQLLTGHTDGDPGTTLEPSQKLETTARHRSGIDFPVELAISLAGSGDSCQRSAFVRDIRARKEQDRKLRHAKEQAEAGNRAKSNFLATMSHEIRTPINGVMGMIELLLRDNPTEKQRSYAEKALRSGRTLLAVIDDILDFSKIEADKLDLVNAPFDVRTVVEDVMLTVAPQARQKRLTLTKNIAPELPNLILGDEARLRQVLLNLVGNAVKFTESGDISITVSEPERDDNHLILQFEVRDTGIGVDAQRLDEMFDAFTQEDGTTTRRYGGTGLGLAISRRLVHLMGGRIGGQSEKNQGSTFHFSARFETVDQTAESAPVTAEASATDSRAIPPAGRHRILVVEDNPVNQEVTLGMLEMLGHAAKLADNGKNALRTLQKDRYDLILMDCQMPIMDGLEATRAIRALEKPGEHIPVIALTADVQKGIRKQCQAAGLDDYLSKPFTLETLEAILGRWLPNGRIGSISPHRRPTPQPDNDQYPVLDGQALDNLRSLQRPGSPDLVQKVIHAYFDSAPTLFQAIRSAVERGDAKGLREASHALKASSSHIGARRLMQTCGTIETLGRENRQSEALALLEPLQEQYDAVEMELLVRLESEPRKAL